MLISVNRAIINIGKDRENLSILTDYEVVPLLVQLVYTVSRLTETVQLSIHCSQSCMLSYFPSIVECLRIIAENLTPRASQSRPHARVLVLRHLCLIKEISTSCYR